MKRKLTIEETKALLWDALSALNEIVEDSKNSYSTEELKELQDLMSRVHFLKELCTIHVQAARQSGHTSTIMEFIEEEGVKALYFTTNASYARKIKEDYIPNKMKDLVTVSTWKDANKVSFVGVGSIWVDPATHACKKAMHCVYDRAAEQLAITGKPPTIYLVS